MSDPVRGIEHLAGLKNHLDHMLIGMGLCGFLGVCGKNKEVHLGAGGYPTWTHGFKFFITIE
jgi:hypothetical protein